MAKAGDDATTWIRYSQAKAHVGEYLGNTEVAEREIRKGLAAGEIAWQCVRFDTPKGYSGPGRGGAGFWRKPDNLNEAGGPFRLEWLVIKGDWARHINGAEASGIDLYRSALVEQGLLPPDAVDATLAKVWAYRAAQDLRRAGKLDRVTKKIELARLVRAAGGNKAGEDYIRDHVEAWDMWPISKIKV